MSQSSSPRSKSSPVRWALRLAIAVACAAAAAAGDLAFHAHADAQPAPRGREIRAQLTPRRFTTISSEIGARVSHVQAEEGDAFRKGQPLITFDCSMQQAQLAKSQADLAAAEKTWTANKRLAELHSIGQVELDTSQATRNKAAADVDMARTLLSKCVIAAPYSGRVAEQKVRDQQYVQAGQPLLEILDDSALELEFLAPSKWLIWLKRGAKFQVRIDETGKTYPATVVGTGARIDPVSQSIKIKGQIAGRYPELLAGMSGVVVFPANP
ncbi:MAG: efflux RND transporter periplasmic adaptor subunit [Ignavibacteriales bacterium]